LTCLLKEVQQTFTATVGIGANRPIADGRHVFPNGDLLENYLMRTLIIIGVLGVILSITATVYTAERYLSLLQETKIIEALASGDDLMSPKIAVLLHDQEISSLVQNELNARWKHAAMLHSALTTMNNDAIKYELNQMLLWIASCATFAWLLIGLKLFRRKNVSKVTA